MKTLAAFIGLLLFAAVLGLLIGPPLIADMRLSSAMTESLRASVAATAGETTNQLNQVPGFGAWMTSLVPANAMKSAADGAMLPLIVFTVFFALAARRIDARLRQSLIDVFSAIAGATRAIVDWVIIAAPIGVFALVLAMAARVGISLASAMVYYVLAYSAAVVLFALLTYPVAAVAGGIPLPRFTRAVTSGPDYRCKLELIARVAAGAHRRRPVARVATDDHGLRASAVGIGIQGGDSDRVAHWDVVPGQALRCRPRREHNRHGRAHVGRPELHDSGRSPRRDADACDGHHVARHRRAGGRAALLIGADTIPDLFATMANVTGDLVAATIVGRRRVELNVADPEPVAASSDDA